MSCIKVTKTEFGVAAGFVRGRLVIRPVDVLDCLFRFGAIEDVYLTTHFLLEQDA